MFGEIDPKVNSNLTFNILIYNITSVNEVMFSPDLTTFYLLLFRLKNPIDYT